MKDEITIFITTYERPNLLGQCLENLSNQSIKNFKVIVLDNSTISDYKKIIEKYSFLNLDYFKNNKNLGSVRNIFQAFKWNIETKFFMIFHDDDLMDNRFLETSLKIFKLNNNLSWVGSNYKKSNKYSRINKKISYDIFSKSELITEIFKGINFSYSSIVYNKKLIKEVDFFQYLEKYSIIHDRPLILDLISSNSKVCIINTPMIFYRLHENQDSKTSIVNLNIGNQLNFYEYYLTNYNKNIFNTFLFNLFISRNIVSSFYRLSNPEKISLNYFLKKAKKIKIINIFFPIFYIFAKIYFLNNKIYRMFNKSKYFINL